MSDDEDSRTGARKRAPAGAAVLQEDVTAALKAALIEELAESGYGRTSIEAVARRARAGKTALYRRWASKEDMVIDVLSEIAWQQVDMADLGSLNEDIAAFLTDLRAALSHPQARAIIPDMLAEAHRNPELRERLGEAVRDPRRQRAAQLIEHGIARGDLPAGVDAALALDLVAGPLYWRMAVLQEEISDAELKRLAASIEAAFAAL